MDNSNLSTSGGSSDNDTGSETGSSGTSGDLNSSDDNSNNNSSDDEKISVSDTAIDLGVYSDLGVTYWISDTSYMSSSWSGSGTSSDPYLISCAEDLAYLSYSVFIGESTYSGTYFEQTADIDLSAHYWMAIGGHCSSGYSGSYYFAGNYDGGGYTISGLETYYDSSSTTSYFNYTGLFGYILGTTSTNATVSNITLSCNVVGYIDVGAIAGLSYYSRISNCIISGSVYGLYTYIGGVSGSVNGVTISNCVNNAMVSSETHDVGGIGGLVRVNSSISNCENHGDITGSYSCGGIAGAVTGNVYVYNCYNDATVTTTATSGTAQAGGICGYANSSSYVYNCYNNGTVIGSGYSVGGVVGRFFSGYIYNCYNTGSVTGSHNVGGISGKLGDYDTSYIAYIYNCFNIGDLTTYGVSYPTYVGGITGSFSYGSIYNSYFGGKITVNDGGDYSEQGVGYVESSNTGSADTTYISNLSIYAKFESWYTSEGYWDTTYPWDFSSTWTFVSGQNDDYPILNNFILSVLSYDEDEGYWYYEDGYLPQSYYGTITPDNVDEDSPDSYITLEIDSDVWAQVAIYSNEYALVTIFSGTSEVSSAWFNVEPVRWIVAYGTSRPEEVTTAVTAYVVTCGAVEVGSVSTGWTWWRSTMREGLGTLEQAMEMEYASVATWAYDAFNSKLSNVIVNDDEFSAMSVLTVSSIAEIDALGGSSYKTSCTDFVAFLMSSGSSTSGSTCDYWTRDLAYENDSGSYSGSVGCGVYITSGGTISNAWLYNCFGARLSVTL